jgi:hypothetical protein
MSCNSRIVFISQQESIFVLKVKAPFDGLSSEPGYIIGMNLLNPLVRRKVKILLASEVGNGLCICSETRFR